MDLQYTNTNNNLVKVTVKDLEDAIDFQRTIYQAHEDTDVYVVDYEFSPTVKETIKVFSLNMLLNNRFNKEALEEHIIMLQHGKLSDDEFWETIEKLNWPSDLDYKRISKELSEGKYGNKGFALALSNKFQEMKNKLYDNIFDSLDKKGLSYDKTIGLGDDSLDDLCSNIIGHGKKMYEKSLNNPVYAGKQDTNESFAYSFQFEFEKEAQ